MMLTELKYPFNFRWHVAGDAAVIGWSYDERGEAISGSRLASRFGSIGTREEFKTVLSSLNGHFAVVFMSKSIRAAAVDHIRSFPVLYRDADGKLEFSSEVKDTDLLQGEIDPVMSGCFIRSWCTPGNNTLRKDTRQLQAGQFIWQEGAQPSTPENYYRHVVRNKTDLGRGDLIDAGVHILDNVFARLAGNLSALKPDRVVVPLSGGYDSRLVLAMLHRSGFRNVMAYTYGRPGSHEVRIAREVAQKLRIEWHFIEYDRTAFEPFFSDSWRSYSDSNHFLCALPHEQDFFALHALQSSGLLKERFIAISGYCGDLLGGSITAYRPDSWSASGLERFIRQRHFGGEDLPTGMDPGLQVGEIHDLTTFYDAYQQYFVSNKVTKFIVNSVRVYEHFGGSWLLPLWDRELVDFFYAIPYALRREQSLYNELIFQHVFKPMGIDIRKPAFDDNYPGRWKQHIRPFIPKKWLDLAAKLAGSNDRTDPNALDLLNRMIYRELKSPPAARIKEINTTHANYFLENLKK